MLRESSQTMSEKTVLFLPNSFLQSQYPSASAGPSFRLYHLSNILSASLSRYITFGLLVIFPVIPVVPWRGITLDLLVILPVIPVIPGCGSSLRLLSDLNDFVTSTF